MRFSSQFVKPNVSSAFFFKQKLNKIEEKGASYRTNRSQKRVRPAAPQRRRTRRQKKKKSNNARAAKPSGKVAPFPHCIHST